jgi:hypothetical protein
MKMQVNIVNEVSNKYTAKLKLAPLMKTDRSAKEVFPWERWLSYGNQYVSFGTHVGVLDCIDKTTNTYWNCEHVTLKSNRSASVFLTNLADNWSKSSQLESIMEQREPLIIERSKILSSPLLFLNRSAQRRLIEVERKLDELELLLCETTAPKDSEFEKIMTILEKMQHKMDNSVRLLHERDNQEA